MLKSIAKTSKNENFVYERAYVGNPVILLPSNLTKNAIEESEHERLLNEKKTYVFTSNDYAKVTDGSFLLADLIEKFDAGYRTISVVDKNKRFEGAITLQSFREDFSFKSIPITIRFFKNLCLQSAPVEELLYKAAEYCVDYCLEEIPVIKDRTVISSAIGTGLPVEGVGHRQVHDIQPARWDLILENVAKPFFRDKKNILISSEEGFLKGFKEVFQEWFDVTVYNDSHLEECLSGKYDILIYDADVWSGEDMPKVRAQQLYGDLLAESVAHYLLGQGVRYYFFDQHDLPEDIDNRMAPLDSCLQFLFSFREGEEKYFVQSGHKIQDTCSGRRLTKSSLSVEHNNIYVYGRCLALGAFSTSYDGTVESDLQALVNENDKPYQVVNCGNTATINNLYTDINHLYHIMDTSFRPGDIVIQFGSSFFRKEFFSYASRNIHCVNKPFNTTHRDFKGFFYHCTAHMTKDGYKIVAEYIFSVIRDTLSSQVYQHSIIKPYFKQFSYSNAKIQNENLQSYLKKIHPVFESEAYIGAMVIGADELKSHPHLLEQALEVTDRLYVFLKELPEVELANFADSLPIAADCQLAQRVHYLLANSCSRDEYCFGAPPPLFTKRKETFIPVEDAYIFARYIAPKLHIRTYFARQYSSDSLDYKYDMLIRDFLLNEGLKFVFLA